jgi:hypothetical protein
MILLIGVWASITVIIAGFSYPIFVGVCLTFGFIWIYHILDEEIIEDDKTKIY